MGDNSPLPKVRPLDNLEKARLLIPVPEFNPKLAKMIQPKKSAVAKESPSSGAFATTSARLKVVVCGANWQSWNRKRDAIERKWHVQKLL